MEAIDKFKKQCGKIYLLSTGNMTFHCTLCEKQFNGFDDFASHVNLTHQQKQSDYKMEVKKEIKEFTDEHEETSMPPMAMDSSNDNDEIQNTLLEPELNLCQEEEEELTFEHIESKKINLKENDDKGLHCPHCKYIGKDKSNFRAHVKRHFEENKTNKCKQCPLAFHSPRELKRHLVTHTGEKAFLCDECGKTYSEKRKLNEHFKRHLNLRDLRCSLCEKSFFRKRSLEEHMVVHTNNRRYSCNICQSRFKLKRALRTHLKIHENQLQYKCTLCPARFNQGPGLRSHMRSKHESVT